MPHFRDIPRFYRAAYSVDVDWNYLEQWLQQQSEIYGLDLDPDFQRPHVWDDSKRSRYVEYCLREGEYARSIYFNSPGFDDGTPFGPMVIVDGKQRLEAVRRFLRDEVLAFGYRLSEYGGHLSPLRARFRVHVSDFRTQREVLQFYLDINAGGVVHTDEELSKVRAMLEAAQD